MNIIYVALSVLSLLAFIIAAFVKGEQIKKNLFLVFIGNILSGTSYLFAADGINGAVSAYIGSVPAIINYFFRKHGKKLPLWLLFAYALLFLAINLAVINSPVGIFAIAACLCAVGYISAENGRGYRFWQAMNGICWICYDFLSKSYAPLAVHLVLFVFTVAAIAVNDRKVKTH